MLAGGKGGGVEPIPTKGPWVRISLYTHNQIKLSRSPGIDSKESIPPANVAWAGLYDSPISTQFLILVYCSKILKFEHRGLRMRQYMFR